MWIVRLALRRPYTFVVVSLLIAILGVAAIITMPVDIFPYIDIPIVSVLWVYNGLSPEEMEKRVVTSFERSLTSNVNDIEHIESQSYNGYAAIRIYFHPNVKVDMAVAQVTATMQTSLRQMPPGMFPANILKYDAASVPILQLGLLSKTLREQEIFDLGQNFIRTQLGTVQGASVGYPFGGKQRAVMVDLNPEELYAKQLSPIDVSNALNLQNLILPAGTAKIAGTEYQVRVNSSPLVLDELNNLPIKTVNGATVYMKDVAQVRAATLVAHGNNDFNVMTKNAAQFYAALRKRDVPHMFYFHQGGHGGAPPDVLVNYWFTRYLYGVQNGVETLPRSWVVREPAACPPRQTTVTGDQSNTATLVVADTSPFRIGFTLTVPQTNADGTVTNTTRLIARIPDATHLVLSSAVATGAGQKVADGTVVSLVCGSANPTPYAEWPDPATSDATLRLTPGGQTRGGLTLGQGGDGTETLVDDASVPGITSANAANSNVRLVYQTAPLTQPVRISGTPTASLDLAFSAARANVTAALVSYPPTGNGTILTRGWVDPANRYSDWADAPLGPGQPYRINVDLQPKDSVVPAGNRLALMVFSSDRDFTIRPAPGTQLTLGLDGSSMTLPVVGGSQALRAAIG